MKQRWAAMEELVVSYLLEDITRKKILKLCQALSLQIERFSWPQNVLRHFPQLYKKNFFEALCRSLKLSGAIYFILDFAPYLAFCCRSSF